MKVFVAGATGETGRRVVQELVDQGIAVRALVRSIEKGKQVLPSGVEMVVGDVLQPQGLREAIADCTAIICATGAAPSFDITGPYRVDYEGTKNLVDTAKAVGINRLILVSSLCVSQFFHPLNLFWLVLYWKKQAEAYLQASGLIYTIVRPGGLKNDDSPNAVVMSGADTLFEGSIPRTKVAQVCVAALSDAGANHKIVEIVAAENAPTRQWSELFASVG